MNYCTVDIDIDVFKHKKSILSFYTTEELEKELENRKNFPDYSFVDKKWDSLEYEYEIDLQDYESEILDELEDSDCIKHLENNYYMVYREDDYPRDIIDVNKKNVALMLGLKEHATKKQILEELEYIL